MANPTTSHGRVKASKKPHPDYPLTPRGDGRWQKKVRGRFYYFRGTADQALDEWLRVKDDILAGRDARPETGQLTVEDLLNAFLTFKRDQVSSGELAENSWRDYKAACEHVVNVFGRTRVVDTLTADDFAKLRRHLMRGRGPVTVKNLITHIRVLFKFAYDHELIDRPLRGAQTALKRPRKDVLRRAKEANGENLFTRDETVAILKASTPQMKAMVLLALNAGLGNKDVADLDESHIRGDWLVYARRKTGIKRRAMLWPETLEAIKAAGGLPFRTKYGGKWVDDNTTHNALAKEMRKLLHKLGVTKKGLGFYSLRHVFRTVADEVKDQPAIDLVMGRAGPSMASHYRERISDDRLQAVSEHVREWLFGKSESTTSGQSRLRVVGL